MNYDSLERGMSETLLAVSANHNEPPISELLPRAVATVPLDKLLRTLATIATSLANAEDRGIDDVHFWRNLAESLYESGPLPSELIKGLESGWRVTNTTELANLALFAIRYRNYTGLEAPIEFLRLLGLYNFAERKHQHSDEFYLDPDSIEAGFAVTTSHRTRFMNVADRYLAFVEWSDACGPGRSREDVRALVEATVGMSFEDYLRCVAALQNYFNPVGVEVDEVRPLSRHAIRANVPLLGWLDKRSFTPDEVDVELGDAPLKTLRSRGHFLVLVKPFVRLGELHYLLNPRALDNALGLGVFYAAMEASTAQTGMDEVARVKAAKTFGGVAGRYYEQHAGERVRRIAQRSNAAFSGEVLDDEKLRSADYFVLEGDCLIVFEMHHRHVPRPVVENLDPCAIKNTFETVLYAKVEQLDRTLRKFADGRLVIPNIHRNQVRRIYPVVCLPAAFPRNLAIQRKIDADVASRGWLLTKVGRSEVAPLEIIESESLEGLDGLEEPVRFSDLIDEKVCNARTRPIFFKNFLVSAKNMKLQMNLNDQSRRAAVLQRFLDEAGDWILG